MQNHKRELMEKEYNYIYEKYFNVLNVEEELTKMKSRPASKCGALVNDKEYSLYRYKRGEVLLVPKVHCIFKGDFDNIYQICATRNIGMDFSITSKCNGVIKHFFYGFLINGLSYNDDYVEAIVNCLTMDDPENELYKDYKEKGITSEKYLNGKYILDLNLPRKTEIFEIHRHKDGKAEKLNYPKFEELHKMLKPRNYKFKPIKVDKDAPLISVVEDIIEDNGFSRIRKIVK